MEKLPPTSYVRMVDIWLIFGQLIPFIEVALLTIMEHLNDPDEINHHGMAREVQVWIWWFSSNIIKHSFCRQINQQSF